MYNGCTCVTCFYMYVCTYTRIAGRSRNITVSAGLTRVSLGAARNDITAIEVCPPKSIAGDTRTYDPLVKMKCI